MTFDWWPRAKAVTVATAKQPGGNGKTVRRTGVTEIARGSHEKTSRSRKYESWATCLKLKKFRKYIQTERPFSPSMESTVRALLKKLSKTFIKVRTPKRNVFNELKRLKPMTNKRYISPIGCNWIQTTLGRSWVKVLHELSRLADRCFSVDEITTVYEK